jgi:hypothetical protein
MPPDPAVGSPLWRLPAIVVAALLLLISAPAVTDARDAPAPRPALIGSRAEAALGDTSARTTTSTSRPPQQPSSDASSIVLPLVLAALLFLALLVPSTGYHWHRHWHPR